MRRLLTVLLILIFGLFVTTAAMAESLTILGTGDGVAVLKSVGDAFTKETGVTVIVPKSIGSGSGIKACGYGPGKTCPCSEENQGQ